MTVTSTPVPVPPGAGSHQTKPQTKPQTKRPSPAARRIGYLTGALVNAAMLYAVNVWPGWDALPFLTSDTERVLLAVNASIVAGLVVNLVHLGHDPLWLRGLGDMVTTAFSLVAMVRIWDVFPFSFPDGGLDWELVARVLLVLGIAGTAIGFVAGAVAMLRHLPGRR